MLKILIVGVRGQLGQDMKAIAASIGHAVSGVDVPDIDITDPIVTQRVIAAHTPEVIINCSAYTAVDACETHEREAFAVNSDGAAHIAQAARAIDARVVHFSTDYVFDGAKNGPYVETDVPNPQSVYGKSKLEGDRRLEQTLPNHIILRVAWLYGVHGKHFINKIKDRAFQIKGTGKPLKVVTDEIGTPTYTVDVCRQTLKLLTLDHRGTFHCTNEGFCTRFEFAREILNTYAIDVPLEPCTSKDFVLPAQRPAYGVLENQRLKQLRINIMRDWKVAFGEYVEEERIKK
jgi:dTDP-4-dehydrorhamnose reductase